MTVSAFFGMSERSIFPTSTIVAILILPGVTPARSRSFSSQNRQGPNLLRSNSPAFER
jgi:hypothetical protein